MVGTRRGSSSGSCSVKEGILEILDERLGAFLSMMVAMMGALTLTFLEFRSCRPPKFFGKKDPIASTRWLVDVTNAFQTSSCLEGEKVRISSYPLKDRAHDWWEEVGYALRGDAVESRTWENFVTRFWADFAPIIEV